MDLTIGRTFRRRCPRRLCRSLMCLAICVLALGGPLTAQSIPSACIDPAGDTVTTIVDNTIGWAGVAQIQGGKPVILWNQHELAFVSQATRIFIYLHECAHHMLDHVWTGESPRAERDADCWAIVLMYESGMAKGRHINLIESEARRTQGDAMHLGGDRKVESLDACVAARTSARVWHVALDSLLRASADSFRSIQGLPYPRPSSRYGMYWANVDVAGTYDCTINRLRVVECMVFAARDDKRVKTRFQLLQHLIGDWLPAGWAERSDDHPVSGVLESFHAADAATGATLSVEATSDHRIMLRFSPAL